MKVLDPPIFPPHDMVIKAWCHGCGDVVREFITCELMDGLHFCVCVRCVFEMGVEIAERFAPADSQA